MQKKRLYLGPTPDPSQEGMASLSYGILKNHATGHVPSREGHGWVAEARSNSISFADLFSAVF